MASEPAVDLEFLRLARIQACAQMAVNEMPAVNRTEREAWCERTGNSSLVVYRLDDCTVVEWGGWPLAYIPNEMLTEEALLFGTVEGEGREV